MKVVLEEFCAGEAGVAVVESEEGTGVGVWGRVGGRLWRVEACCGGGVEVEVMGWGGF